MRKRKPACDVEDEDETSLMDCGELGETGEGGVRAHQRPSKRALRMAAAEDDSESLTGFNFSGSSDGSVDSDGMVDELERSDRTRCSALATKYDSGRRRRSRREVFQKYHHDMLATHHAIPAKNVAISMENVLTQALKAGDRQLLDSVLRTEDLLVIRATILELPSSLTEKLIDHLITRMQESPIRMRSLGPWMRELFRQKTALCMALPNLREQLAVIYQHAKARLRYADSALKLQGQLDALTYLGYRRLDEQDALKQEKEITEVPLVHIKESNGMLVVKSTPASLSLGTFKMSIRESGRREAVEGAESPLSVSQRCA